MADLAVSVTPFVTLAPYLGSLIEALIKMIPGQIWHGQGQALEVLAMVGTDTIHQFTITTPYLYHQHTLSRFTINTSYQDRGGMMIT